MIVLRIIPYFPEQLAFICHGMDSYDICTHGKLKSMNDLMTLELPCCSGYSRTSGCNHALGILLLSEKADWAFPPDSSLWSLDEEG